MFKKVRWLTRPPQARQDAPFHGQGRSPFDARSVLLVRERERREERQVCEPEGRQNGENAAGGFFQHSLNTFFARASRLNLAQQSTRPIDSISEENPERS